MLTLSSAKPFEWVIEQSTATARFELEKGEERWLVLRYDDDDIHPVDRYESARKLDNTAAFWQQWSSKVQLPRPVPRNGQTFGPGAQAAHPCRDRRHDRRAHHVAPGNDRRHAELGLSLCLAPGRRLHPGRAGRGGAPRARPTSSCAS